MAFQERIQNPTTIERELIERLSQEGKEVIVQFSETTPNEDLLIELDTLCSKYNENFAIRFYGFHGESFNCGIIDKIPNVKSLYVDCLTNAHNINALSRPQSLKKLSLEIFELKETEILNFNNFKNISELRIGNTRTKALNLEYLKGYC
jgi:protein phosphatase 1 regulatory subunit 7